MLKSMERVLGGFLTKGDRRSPQLEIATIRVKWHLFACVIFLFFLNQGLAFPAAFTQTDWSGGSSSATAVSPANQTGWVTFDSSDADTVTANAGADLQISTTADSRQAGSGDFAFSSIQYTRHYSNSDFLTDSIPTNILVSGGNVFLDATSQQPSWVKNVSLDGPSLNSGGYYYTVKLGDLDSDGDLDFMLGRWDGWVIGYENTGTDISPSWAVNNAWNVGDLGAYSGVALADLDGDGDIDLLAGLNTGAIRSFRNDGSQSSPVWVENTSWALTVSGSLARPELADLDNDGDYDLLVGVQNYTYGYRNDGDSSSPIWVANAAWDISGLSSYNSPAVADLDGDGDGDVLIGNNTSMLAYENTGIVASLWAAKPAWNATAVSQTYSSPALGDIDGDGDQDLLVGDYYANLWGYENTGTVYYTSGNLVSSVIDTGDHANYSTLNYAVNIPASTSLSVDVRAGDSATVDGSWTGWQVNISDGADISVLLGNKRYVQYRLTLSTADTSITPRLSEITFNFLNYATGTNVMLTENGITLGLNFNPVALGLYSSPYSLSSVHLAGNYIFSADDSGNSNSRFRIIDVSNPAAPSSPASTAHGTRIYDAYVQGNYAYVAVTSSGLAIVDISNPLAPVTVTTVDTPGWAYGVHVVGNYAYVADWTTGGLQIIDITTPSTAFRVGNGYDTPGDARAVFVSGDYAYLADGTAGLQIIDIADRANPLLIANYPGTAYRVEVKGNFAYIVGAGLKIIDISDPSSPKLVSSSSDVSAGSGIHIVGDYAYVSDAGAVKIIDISDPSTPSLASSVSISSGDIYVSGKYAYTSNGTGMQVISLGDYAPSGSYYSSIIDAGQHVGYTTVDYNATIPANTTLVVSVRSGNTPMPEGGGWTTWQLLSNSGDDISTQSTNRYLQYKVDFTSSDANVTSRLEDITINFNRYAFSTTLTSSAYDTTTTGNLVEALAWNETLPADTEIRLQLRSAADASGVPGAWSSWQGPDGTSDSFWSSSNVYAGGCSGSGSVTCTVLSSRLRDGIDEQWIQYKITLVSTGGSTPTLADISVSYATETTNGITVTPTSLATSESTLSAVTFSVSLASAPSNDVTLYLYSEDTSEGLVSPSSLTFTNADWASKTVTVTPVNDDIDDGNITYSIITAAAVSADATYHNVNPSDVIVTHSDDDSSGVALLPSSGLVTTEAGGIANFDVRLTSKPLSDVTISLSSSDTSEGVVSPASLVFTSANWNSWQTVTVTGVDDSIIDGDIAYSILTDAAVSSDPTYSGFNAANVSLTNSDDDAASLIISPSGMLTVSESGAIAPFSVMLSSQPSSDVTFALSSSDTSEGIIFEWSMTFTPSNWNVPQTSAVYGKNDELTDGDVIFYILTGTMISADSNFNGSNPPDIPVTNTDDDGYTITISPSSKLVTTEDGGEAMFTIKLGTQPSADVTILLSSSDPTEGIVPTSVVLTPNDISWYGKTVTITGLDDEEFDGDKPYTIITSAAISADSNFNGIDPVDVSVINRDNNYDVTMLESNQNSYVSGLTTYYMEYGATLASAGDVNGDGYPDLIVGGEGYSNGQSLEGRAFIYHGSASGYSNTPDWTAESDQGQAYFGHSVASAGDVNGDGYDDVIVGAYWYSNGQTREGRAYLYYGSASGLSTSPDWTAESDQAYSYFGSAVNTAGDVNGDGYDDIVVGAYLYDSTLSNAGRLFVYYGSASGPSLVPDWTVDGAVPTTYLGKAVASAGDVNNDGYDDLIAGGYLYSNGQTYEGAAFLYYGSAGGLSISPDWSYQSDQAYAYLGTSVSSAGDINGDGYMDVIVGAGGYNGTLTDEGRAYVFHGSASGLSLVPDWVADGKQSSANFGDAVASAGDVNNDGYNDVIVGAWSYDTNFLNVGRAEIYFGSASGLSPTPDWIREGTQANGYFGAGVGTVGDVNQDGYTDIVVGASRFDNGHSDEGAVFVYLSSVQTISRTATITPTSGLITTEAGGTTTFTMVLDTHPKADVIVGLSTSDASEGIVSPISLTFTPNNWYVPQTITVSGVDDSDDDGDVVYSVITAPVSSSDSNFNGVNFADVSVTNVNNERTATITATDAIAAEEALNRGTFTVSHSGFTNAPLTVNYTVSGTATAGSDYTALSGTITIPTSQSSATITLTPLEDTLIEGNENIIVTLSSGSGYVIGSPNNASVTIGDNDSAGIIVSPVTGLITTEAGGTAYFDVVLTNTPLSDVTIYLVSSDTGEGAPIPSSLTFTPSNWSASQRVTVVGADDTVSDGDISYTIFTTTASSDGNYSVINPSDVDVINSDDDAAGNVNVKVGVLNASVAENSGSSGLFRVTRSVASASPLTVQFMLSGSAIHGVDYNSIGTSVVIPGGSKGVDIAVTPRNDNLFETDESVVITLSSGAGYTIDRPNAATITLLDDEQVAPAKVNFTLDQIIEEGSGFTLTATLDKDASVYPVTIPFTVSGTALNPADHNAAAGSIIISAGKVGSVSFTTVDDGANESDETVIFTMETPSNAEKGVKVTHTVTVTELNAMPSVLLNISQGGPATGLIVRGSGMVTITATVTDVNLTDTHTYDWSLTNNGLIDSNLDGDPATFIFDPSSLGAGFYNVVLSVTDNGTPAKTGKVERLLEVVNSAPLLTADDSDGDGITDDVESYEDSDGDGIPNYKDASNLASHELQAVDATAGSYIIRTEEGLTLRLGEVAFAAYADGAEVSLDDIASYGGGEGSAGVDPNDGVPNTGGYFDYEIWGLVKEGQSAKLVIPQFNVIPNGAIYRKYFGDTGWQDFVEDANNSLASAVGTPGLCPPPGDGSYRAGLNEGDFCIQLTIEDGGPNDTDRLANHVIVDPGTLSISVGTQEIGGSNDNSQEGNAKSPGGGGGKVSVLLLIVLLMRCWIGSKLYRNAFRVII